MTRTIKAAMSWLCAAQARAENAPATSYAPIAQSLLAMEEADKARIENQD